MWMASAGVDVVENAFDDSSTTTTVLEGHYSGNLASL